MNYQGLKSYDGKISDLEFNKLVDAVQANGLNQGVGYTLTQTAGGTTLNIKASKNHVSGQYGNPYILGSLASGSSGTGWYGAVGGVTGQYWGGSGDAQTVGVTGAYQDTWHRDRPPLTTGNVPTTGVKMDLTRYLDNISSFSVDRTTFTRTALFDSRGGLVSISAETIEETNTISGYGSAGGGI